MKKSHLTAIGMTLAVVAWIASGQFGGHPADAEATSNPGAAATPAGETAAAAPGTVAGGRMTVRARASVAMPRAGEITLRGRTEALRTVALKAETEGRVVGLPVEKGALVQEGTVICRLATDDRAATLAQARATLRQRELENSASTQLAAKGFTSQTRAAESAAQLDGAKAMVQRMEVELSRAEIRAPFDGVVEERPAEIGALLMKGAPCATLVDSDPMLVVGDVAERDVSLVRVGQEGHARLIDGTEVAGHIRFVARTAQATTRTFRVELEVPNPDASLKSGISADVGVPTPAIAAHLVSPAILGLDDAGLVGVRTVDATGVVAFVPVTPVASTPEGMWVAGLPERVILITVGQDYVRAGETVSVVMEGTAVMSALIQAFIRYPRTILSFMVMLLVAGVFTFAHMPRESDPDIDIPIIMVQVALDGISPNDGERLLLRPIEKELKTIEGIKEMRSTAAEGYAFVILEFDAGFNSNKALNDVRAKVDRARSELPTEAREPAIEQFNVSLFPILLVTLSGDVEARTLIQLARDLRIRIEGLPQVLSANVAGDREELLEIVVDPVKLEAYDISQEALLRAVSANNRLVAAGSLDTGLGRFAIKVPGLFEKAEDVLDLPLKVDGNGIVKLSDLASVRRTFKDADAFARIDGKQAVTLEIKKRTGQNVIDTVAEVKKLTMAVSANWPGSVQVAFGQDSSKDIHDMLGELQNSVLLAVLLVMIVVVASLGTRSSALVGIAIPGSFLFGLLCLSLMGLTLNMMVMFSMILVVGMVVDGAIIVVEYADRKMVEGHDRREAYAMAAQRMAWPVLSTTATTGLVFAPLLFWPGVTGKFMSYLPLTLLLTLVGSILVALVFIPVLGAMFGKPGAEDEETLKAIEASETGDVRTIRGLTGLYARVVDRLIHHPVKVLGICLVVMVATFALYGRYGHGVEFFPQAEPRQALVFIHARGNLAIAEKGSLVREVEARVLKIAGMDHVYTTIGGGGGGGGRGQDVGDDVIGQLSLEFAEWDTRPTAAKILDEVVRRTADISGIKVETRLPDAGPPTGKKIQIEIGSDFPERIAPVVDTIRRHLDAMQGLVDVEDTRPLPGIEWQFRVDRAQAGLFGADVASVGGVVQLVTNGIKIGEYRPDDADKEVDIRVRYPLADRDMAQFDRLRVQTRQGMVPISSFVTRTAEPLVGTVNRTDGRRVLMVRANTAEGVLPNDKVNEIRDWLATQKFDEAVRIRFKGQDKEQRAAGDFLAKAFLVGIFLMAIVLITQFNSFYYTFVILSAVLLSTVGVFVGLLVTGQVFSMVMTGIGVISLAGVVVAHNIVLLDTYVHLRAEGKEIFDAILRTSVQRLRPVMLTTITTMTGLVPMAMQFNIDFFTREVLIGAPSTQWWVQMATAIIFGLAFATLLTLIVTPCLVTLPHVVRQSWRPALARLGLGAGRAAGGGAQPQLAE